LVSIPSSGSIQFLQDGLEKVEKYSWESQSPQAGQFNSYTQDMLSDPNMKLKSQSPQAGQFNSYPVYLGTVPTAVKVSIPSSGSIQFLRYHGHERNTIHNDASQSPQTGQFNSYHYAFFNLYIANLGLNPLKRVNSILTAAFSSDCRARGWKVKKDSDSKKVVEGVGGIFFDLI